MNCPPEFDESHALQRFVQVPKRTLATRFSMYRDLKHFSNLTPLRFVAAYLVLIFHVEETRKMFAAPNLTQFSLFTHGPMAVTFFFVLSGFLITYLLLREGERLGRIDVPRFYVRRMLRIWPLYFLLVFIGLVLIPAGVKLGRVPYEAPFEPRQVAPYFLLFVPFVVNLRYGNHFLTPLWSVGIEEMYYLGWAPVVKWFRRHLLAIMLGTVAAKAVLAGWAQWVLHDAFTQEVLRLLQFEAMAIGGLAAYFLFHRTRALDLNWLFSRPVQVLLMLPLVVRLFAHRAAVEYSTLYAAVFDDAVFTPLLLMALFAWFIVNVAVNERSIIRLDSPALNYLGDISYGVYMYHGLAISLVFVPFVKEFQDAPLVPTTLLLHTLVATLTVGFAAVSKRLFEDKFLRHKFRFDPVGNRQERAHRSHGTQNKPRTLAA
jgi:peptidoglycan/LPS O-acetylase OafA/YrhL